MQRFFYFLFLEFLLEMGIAKNVSVMTNIRDTHSQNTFVMATSKMQVVYMRLVIGDVGHLRISVRLYHQRRGLSFSQRERERRGLSMHVSDDYHQRLEKPHL